MREKSPHEGIAGFAYQATGGDPLLALALVCDLLKAGLLVQTAYGSVVRAPQKAIAA